jgi:hypothetical protein
MIKRKIGGLMQILKPTDIVTVKQGEIEVDFTPLRYGQSLEVVQAVVVKDGEIIPDIGKQTAMMIKYSLKEVRGVKDYSGEAIEIKAKNKELDEDNLSMAITVLSKTPFLQPMSYISTACEIKHYEGVEIKVNGKEVKLGNGLTTVS